MIDLFGEEATAELVGGISAPRYFRASGEGPIEEGVIVRERVERVLMDEEQVPDGAMIEGELNWG